MSDETKLDIAGIKARLEAITGGQWEYAHGGMYKDGKYELDEYFVRREDDDVSIAADTLDPDTCDPSEANAVFIAHAPQDIAGLIAAYEAKCAEVDELLRLLSYTD